MGGRPPPAWRRQNAHRDARRLGVILNQVHDAVDAAVHRAAAVILAAKTITRGSF